MSGSLIPDLFRRAIDANGDAIPGALANFYLTGTLTRTPTYTTAALSTANPNPVVADSGGLFPPIFLDPAVTYRRIMTYADGSAIPLDDDPISGYGQTGGATQYTTVAAAAALNIPPATIAVQTLGFAAVGDGGAGFYLPTGVSGAGAGKFQSADGQWWILSTNAPNVLQFGADPTGSAASDTAFEAIQAYVGATQRVNAGADLGPTSFLGATIILPPGSYLLEKSASFLGSSIGTFGSTYLWGLRIVGAGRGTTQILYRPTSSGPLIEASNLVIDLGISGIRFDCNDAASDFCDSTASTGQQNFKFEDCLWAGSWQYGMNLAGSNNNSEHVYSRCWFHIAVLTAWQYVAAAVGEPGDQFVNYTYENCNWDTFTAPWIVMYTGGHVHIRDCNIDNWSPAAATYIWQLYGQNHDLAACFFSLDNVRVEASNTNALMMYAEWDIGTIKFNGLDMSSQASAVSGAAAVSYFNFNPGNTDGAKISFRDCDLMGKTTFQASGAAYAWQSLVKYDQCGFLNQATLHDAFVFDNLATNAGSLPHVAVRRCRPGINIEGAFSVQDADFNWMTRQVASIEERTIIINGPNSALIPNGNASAGNACQFAEGQMVTKVRVIGVLNYTGSGLTVTVETSDTPPIVLGNTTIGAGATSNYTVDLMPGVVLGNATNTLVKVRTSDPTNYFDGFIAVNELG